ETSHRNFQWGYKLCTPITDAAVASAFIHQIRITLTGAQTPDGKPIADPGMEAVTRYMRMPCGVNLKKTLGKPWRIRLVKLDPSICIKLPKVFQAYPNAGSGGAGSLSRDNEVPTVAGVQGDQGLLTPSHPNSPPRRVVAGENDTLLKALRKLGLVL